MGKSEGAGKKKGVGAVMRGECWDPSDREKSNYSFTAVSKSAFF